MIRRVLGLVGAMALLVGASEGAIAQSPEGPRLGFLKFGPLFYSAAFMTVDPAGAQPETLIRASRRTRPYPLAFEGPAWFPDGTRFAFTGLTGSLQEGSGPGGMRIFVMDMGGGSPLPIARTEGGQVPVVSPDGRTIAFVRTRERTRVERHPGKYTERVERAVSIWIVGVDDGALRRLTPWRYGVEQFPSSFSPDGSVLAVTRVVNGGPPSALALRLDGTGADVIVRNAAVPMFSPDGDRVAYLRQGRKYREHEENGTSVARLTDLFITDVEGSRTVRLTHTPKRLESGPSWDPGEQRLAFVQSGTVGDFFETFGRGNALVQINGDGTCRTKVLSLKNATIFGPSWQPGPGREAGRISC